MSTKPIVECVQTIKGVRISLQKMYISPKNHTNPRTGEVLSKARKARGKGAEVSYFFYGVTRKELLENKRKGRKNTYDIDVMRVIEKDGSVDRTVSYHFNLRSAKDGTGRRFTVVHTDNVPKKAAADEFIDLSPILLTARVWKKSA